MQHSACRALAWGSAEQFLVLTLPLSRLALLLFLPQVDLPFISSSEE